MTDMQDSNSCSQLKKSELFSGKKPKFHRWLEKEDKEEDRLKSFKPSEVNKLKSLSSNSTLDKKFKEIKNEEVFQSMHSLIEEKEKLNQEQ